MPEWQHVFVSVACEETAGTHVVTLMAFTVRTPYSKYSTALTVELGGTLSAVGRMSNQNDGRRVERLKGPSSLESLEVLRTNHRRAFARAPPLKGSVSASLKQRANHSGSPANYWPLMHPTSMVGFQTFPFWLWRNLP